MTRQPDCTLSTEFMQMIAEQGLDAMPELIGIIVNAATQAESQQFLRAARTSELPNARAMLTATSRKQSPPAWAK